MYLRGGMGWINGSPLDRCTRFDRRLLGGGLGRFQGSVVSRRLGYGVGCRGEVPEVAGGVFAFPMARTASETVSDLVLSRIFFSFSSFFTGIWTGSSGITLLELY